MRRPAAKQGDRIVASDTHIVMVPAGSAELPLPMLHPFAGAIDGALSADVRIMGRPAATLGSTATNRPAHVPTSPGARFFKPPTNRGTIARGSATVFVNGKPAARDGDVALTCNDPADAPVGQVVAVGTVFIG